MDECYECPICGMYWDSEEDANECCEDILEDD